MGMFGAIAGGAGGLLLVFGAVLIALAIHPFTTYPLSLRWLVRWRPRPVRVGAPELQPRAALCVCAYNEEQVIRAKVENMLAMRQAVPGLEILVYVDAASDRTAEILRGYGDALHLVVSPVRHGKTYGMNTLIGLTDAELVVFSDANVMFAADAIPHLLAPFADPEVGVVCGHLRYTGPGGNATALSGSLYWRLEEHIKALESASGSVMGADGSIFAIRRALHEPPPPDLIDDMFVSLAVLCRGMRIVRAADALAFEDAVSRPGEEFRRKIRIGCQAFNVHHALWSRLRGLPLVDRYKYLSHKLLRWLVIYLLGGGVVSLLAGFALIGAPILSASLAVAVLVLLAMLWRAEQGMLATLWDVLRAFSATGIGVWRSLRGDRFQTWSPPVSARSRHPALAPAHDTSRLDQQTAAE
jgi:cellulose synthase/poly-beta-1,6-N-acetylglucosamine synthase-like glycosyltransferase